MAHAADISRPTTGGHKSMLAGGRAPVLSTLGGPKEGVQPNKALPRREAAGLAEKQLLAETDRRSELKKLEDAAAARAALMLERAEAAEDKFGAAQVSRSRRQPQAGKQRHITNSHQAAVAAHDQEERLRRLRESAAASGAGLAEGIADAHAMQQAKHKAAVIAPILAEQEQGGVIPAVREQRLEPGDAVCKETFKALTTKGAVGAFIPPAHAHYKGVSQGPGAAGAPPARIMGGAGAPPARIMGGAGAGGAVLKK